MKRINIKLIVSIALIVLIGILLTTTVFADYDPVSHPEDYAPQTKFDSNSSFVKKSGMVLGWIRYIGIITSVVVLAIIGINYMISSVEGKAEYKKKILPYVIGCCLLMSISVFIGIIQDVATRTYNGGSKAKDILEIEK